jgi:hypothetical protein
MGLGWTQDGLRVHPTTHHFQDGKVILIDLIVKVTFQVRQAFGYDRHFDDLYSLTTQARSQ